MLICNGTTGLADDRAAMIHSTHWGTFIMLRTFYAFCCLLIFFKIYFFEKLLQEYHQSVNQIGSRSGPTFCRA